LGNLYWKFWSETEVSRQTRTQSRAIGTSKTESEGSSENYSEATQTGVTIGETETQSQGSTRSVTDGETSSTAKGSSRTQQKGTNRNKSQNSRQFDTGDFGFSQVLQGVSPFRLDNSATANTQKNRGKSRQTNWGDSRGSTRGGGYSQGNSESQSTGTSQTETAGTSRSNTSGENQSRSHATNRQESNSKTKTIGQGTTHQITTGETQTDTGGFNEALQARPLLAVNEMKKWFAPVSDPSSIHYPGYCLVMIADEDPTAIRRGNYFEDTHFIGWHDPHPDWPENTPPLFKQNMDLPGLPGSDAEEIEWIKEVGEKTKKAEPIARFGPFPYDRDNPFVVEAFEQITSPYADVYSDRAEFYWIIHSTQTGILKTKGKHPDEEHIGEIESNLREIFFDEDIEGILDSGELFDDYLLRIDEHVKISEEEDARRREAERLEQDRLEAEYQQKQKEKRERLEKEERENKRLEALEKSKRLGEAARKAARAAKSAELKATRAAEAAEIEKLLAEFEEKKRRTKQHRDKERKEALKALKILGPVVIILN